MGFLPYAPCQACADSQYRDADAALGYVVYHRSLRIVGCKKHVKELEKQLSKKKSKEE